MDLQSMKCLGNVFSSLSGDCQDLPYPSRIKHSKERGVKNEEEEEDGQK